VLNSIKSLKGYCKVTLNMVFNKKNYLYDKFFDSIEILLFNILKLLKIPGLSRFFFKTSQIPGFLA